MTINNITLTRPRPMGLTRPEGKQNPSGNVENDLPWWMHRRPADKRFNKRLLITSIDLLTLAIKRIG